jgi:hypothetical protein
MSHSHQHFTGKRTAGGKRRKKGTSRKQRRQEQVLRLKGKK